MQKKSVVICAVAKRSLVQQHLCLLSHVGFCQVKRYGECHHAHCIGPDLILLVDEAQSVFGEERGVCRQRNNAFVYKKNIVEIVISDVGVTIFVHLAHPSFAQQWLQGFELQGVDCLGEYLARWF